MLAPATVQAYAELADWLQARQRAGARVVGINGAQGSGKSTLARWLAAELGRRGLRVATLSLDDCYLGRAARAELAARVHPLLATRGVPGTHDVALGRRLLRDLPRLAAGAEQALPTFDKAGDERIDATAARTQAGPVDLLLFEGWCVGTPPQAAAQLARPCNALEAREDADGRWRAWVNAQLAGPYAHWWGDCDALVMLRVPGWEAVHDWRAQQERETAAAAPDGRAPLLEPAALQRFLDHYERLTRHTLQRLPEQADALLELDLAHSVHVARLS